MSRILITGVRAPAALDLIRHLGRAGHTVYAADSLYFPPGRFSKYVKTYIRLPSPRFDFKAYSQRIGVIVEEYAIDFILPTCEEVFYLAALKPSLDCHVLCADLPLLASLHNKARFQDIARTHGMGSITTTVLEKEADKEVLKSLPHNLSYVAKPVFSRFGDKAILNIAPSEIGARLSPGLYPWAVQEFINGTEYCAYALCRNGVVLAHATYLPAYRAGQGSSIYFQPVMHPEIERQVASLVKGILYSGQIAFDFIEDAHGKVFVLECNPRATSGVHLLPPEFDWTGFLNGTPSHPPPRNLPRPKMIALAMLLFGLRTPNEKSFAKFRAAYRAADDVLGTHGDNGPVYGQVLSLLEIAARSIMQGVSLKDASTADIEWDGGEIA